MSRRGIQVEGLDGLVDALLAQAPAVDEAATAALRDWSGREVSRIRSAGRARGGQSALAAHSVTGRPSAKGTMISAGGSGRLPNDSGGTYGDIFFGAEFGSHQGKRKRQFPSWRKKGYWFFPTLAADLDQLQKAGEQGLDAAADVWGR